MEICENEFNISNQQIKDTQKQIFNTSNLVVNRPSHYGAENGFQCIEAML